MSVIGGILAGHKGTIWPRNALRKGESLVYRVESREPLSLETVREEIAREIYLQKMNERTKELKAPVQTTYDEKYFGPPVPAAAPASQAK